MSEMESENLVMNEGVKERLRKRERKGQRFHSPWSFASSLLPYQASPDMGEKHVPTMHCGSCPSAWNEPLSPVLSAQRSAASASGSSSLDSGKDLRAELGRQENTHTNIHKHMYAPDSAIGNQKFKRVQVTSLSASLSKLAVQTWDTDKHNIQICINTTQVQGHADTHLQNIYTNVQSNYKDDILLCVNHWKICFLFVSW